MSYIVFRDIGVIDQLGSQMCNFAVGYTFLKKTGHKIGIVEEDLYRGYGQIKTLKAFDYPFEIIKNTSNFKGIIFKEFPLSEPFKQISLASYNSYDNISIEDIVPGINYQIYGALHFPQKYWINEIEDIKQNFFVFKKEHQVEANNKINSIRQPGKKLVSMHFRRKDYLVMQILNLSLNYYKEALTFFNPKEYQVIIFSDDIEYCKNNLQKLFNNNGTKWDVYISNTNNRNVDMCMMSLCDDNIICNSTFSQWGALLNKNKNKKVICPIGILPDLEEYNPREIFKDWTILTTV
jgi:hypothetical protein